MSACSGFCLAILCLVTLQQSLYTHGNPVFPSVTPDCHTRRYSVNVSTAECWRELQVNACFGQCSSYETFDTSASGVNAPHQTERYHPSCVFDTEIEVNATLTNCIPGHSPVNIVYSEALECKCEECDRAISYCEIGNADAGNT